MVPFTLSYGQKRTNLVHMGSVETYYSMYTVVGIDEVGLGCIAGPMLVAAVHLPEDHGITGIRDSKQLTHLGIISKSMEIRNRAVVAMSEMATHTEIDNEGISTAHRSAVVRLATRVYQTAYNKFQKPIIFILDGTWHPGQLPFPATVVTLVKGDQKSYNVAAASIVAKATRDKLMEMLSEDYPGYEFHKNKGYATQEHKEAVNRLGVTDIHRLTFSNLCRIKNGEFEQESDTV